MDDLVRVQQGRLAGVPGQGTAGGVPHHQTVVAAAHLGVGGVGRDLVAGSGGWAELEQLAELCPELNCGGMKYVFE